MLQSTTVTPFRTPIPAISHLVFGFRPEMFENLSKSFKISITDVCFFTKKVVSLAYAGYKTCSNFLSLSLQTQLITPKLICRQILNLLGVYLFLI